MCFDNNMSRGVDRRSPEATIFFSGRQSCPLYWSVRSTKKHNIIKKEIRIISFICIYSYHSDSSQGSFVTLDFPNENYYPI